jgi:Fe-Mn family superoxide dismutase
MRGISGLLGIAVSLFFTLPTLASEQQPFEFGEMSAPQYSLPPLPYAYDVSLDLSVFSTPYPVLMTW